MQLPYEFFEHTADIGVRVHGATLAELFTNAAAALWAAQGRWQTTGPRREKRLELTAPTAEDLLHDWLAELLFEFTAHGILYEEFDWLLIAPERLQATLRGAAVDFARSQPTVEIKAVTYHQLTVRQQPDGTWTATIIFDV